MGIISGMARGIDGEAHKGVIASNGYTVAVLGSGIECIYPKEHVKLFEQIAECGCVISEFPPKTPPLKSHFPARNRIISGMSRDRVPKLFDYLHYKMKELDAHINGKQFNETYQENQSTQDINNTPNTDNDPVNFASQQESLETLNSPKTILTNEEALKLRPFVGDMPRIAVASEHTDPVFFSKRIIKILNGEEAVQDKFRPVSYTGKDFNALYLITKHDGLPLKELLEQPIPKIIHFSITGLGGTKWEPGVMKPNDLLDRIADFIKQGLDPEMVTVRIDPIVPGVTSTQMIENIVKRASEMGIKKIRYSVMDRYKTTSKFVEALGYDYSKYYPQGGLHATQEIRDQIDGFMVSMKEKYGVELFTCAEPNSKYADKISKEACLSVAAVNNMLGTSIPETATGKQRQLCSCFGGKTDLLRYDNKCSSSCVYCYAHHNLDKNLNYYNEDGTLKDNPFTRTSKPEEQGTPMTPTADDKSTINIHSRDDNGYRELSNFSIRPFTLIQKNGTTASFKSVEQAFQFAKAMFIANNENVAAKILASNNSGEIKQLGRSVPMTAEQIAKWNRLSTDLMYRLMKASFMQNASAKQLLLSTGDAVFTHKNERGQEQDGGRFSKLLMQVRDEIRQMEQEGNEDLNNCKTR